MTTATAAPTRETTALEVRHLADWEVELEPVQLIPTPLGMRATYVLKSGTSQGERLNGEFLPGGGDWLEFGSDGIGRIDVRATLKTDDGELIHVTCTGITRMNPDLLERLRGGERLAWNEMYTRTSPRFETSSERYGWLSGIVTVAVNELGPGDRVSYRIYEVL
jgi:hypothetical protein